MTEMTGRDLIMYILKHKLEDEPIFQNGKMLGFKTVEEVAEELEIGTATVRVWVRLDMIEHVIFENVILIPANYTSPMEIDK